MYELAVAENILQMALWQASKVRADRIADLHLAIGQLSSIVVSVVQSHWEVISRGTPAEGARLHFRHVPTQVQCLACDRRYAPQNGDLACPSCHSTRVKVTAGDEFRLEAIDVEPREAFQIAFTGTKT